MKSPLKMKNKRVANNKNFKLMIQALNATAASTYIVSLINSLLSLDGFSVHARDEWYVDGVCGGKSLQEA